MHRDTLVAGSGGGRRVEERGRCVVEKEEEKMDEERGRQRRGEDGLSWAAEALRGTCVSGLYYLRHLGKG